MYQFAPEARKALEAMPLPIAYYQRVGDGIVAILVSDGLCRMMGADRDDLISLLNGGLFERIHPDDAGRIARIVREFANRLCNYDVIYRGKYNQNDDYHYIHLRRCLLCIIISPEQRNCYRSLSACFYFLYPLEAQWQRPRHSAK